MKLIIAGAILVLTGIVLFVLTLITWRKESFIKSFLAAVTLTVGILIIFSEFGAQLNVPNSQNKVSAQVEYSET